MGYRGNIAHIVLGDYGLLTDVPPGQVPRGALIKANNVSFETGFITKAPGAIRYNTQVLPAGIVGHFDWWPNSVTQRQIVACSNGCIYRDIGDRLFSSATAIATGLGALTPNCQFIEGGFETAARSKKLFFFSGTALPQVLDNDDSTFDAITTPATDWSTPNFPNIGIIHRNRLWAFMGHRVYASSTSDHENFVTSALADNMFSGEGGPIIGAYVFKGRLFAFKEGGFTYYLDDTDPDDSNWVWRKLGSNFGVASSHGIFEITNDMIAINESGAPILFSAINALGDIQSSDLMKIIKMQEFYRNQTSLSGVAMTHAIYYEAKKQAFITCRSGFRTNNDKMLHIDFNREQPRAAFWTKDQADCLSFMKDINKIKRPVYGSSDGYLYIMDREDRLTGSTSYTGEIKIGHTDFRFLDETIASKNKLFDFLDVEFIPQGTWDLSVDVYIDGTFMETIAFSMDVRDDGLDSFTLGSGTTSSTHLATGGDGDPLGREEAQTIRKPLHGSGRQISFHCRQSGSNQNFALASFSVGFRLSDEKASKA